MLKFVKSFVCSELCVILHHQTITIMKTITGVLSASITMASSDYLVQGAFAILTFYLIYRELKSDEELSE
jgi:hypothetical protein